MIRLGDDVLNVIASFLHFDDKVRFGKAMRRNFLHFYDFNNPDFITVRNIHQIFDFNDDNDNEDDCYNFSNDFYYFYPILYVLENYIKKKLIESPPVIYDLILIDSNNNLHHASDNNDENNKININSGMLDDDNNNGYNGDDDISDDDNEIDNNDNDDTSNDDKSNDDASNDEKTNNKKDIAEDLDVIKELENNSNDSNVQCDDYYDYDDYEYCDPSELWRVVYRESEESECPKETLNELPYSGILVDIHEYKYHDKHPQDPHSEFHFEYAHNFEIIYDYSIMNVYVKLFIEFIENTGYKIKYKKMIRRHELENIIGIDIAKVICDFYEHALLHENMNLFCSRCAHFGHLNNDPSCIFYDPLHAEYLIQKKNFHKSENDGSEIDGSEIDGS